MEQINYNLKELCQLTGVSERTIRFYIKEKLLPPPQGPKAFSYYSYEHWLRLELVRYFKANFLPLREIKRQLDAKSVAELEVLAQRAGIATTAPQVKHQEIAMPLATEIVNPLDKQVLSEANQPAFDKFFARPRQNFTAPTMSLPDVPPSSFNPTAPQNRAAFFGAMQPPLTNRPPTFEPYISENSEEVQSWERIQVAPGVELHLEKNVAEHYRASLADLIAEIRRRLEE